MLDRKTPPPFHLIDKINILPLNTQYINNGIPLHTLSAGEQPLLRLELLFPAGTSYEHKSGVSYFTAKMLGEGTKNRSSLQITEDIDGFGAFIEFNHGVERTSIVLYTLNKHLEKLLPILEDLMLNSIFPEKELHNLQNITTQNLKVNEEKTNYLASKRFKELLLGNTHPYGKSLNINDIQLVEQANVLEHYAKNILQKNFEIILVGKLSERELKLVEDFFGQFSVGKNAERPKNDLTTPTLAEKKHFFQKAGSLQSSIRVGKLLFSRHHADYFPMTVTNEIFGGYFGSRLMRNIREDKGFTYGIYSSLVMYKDMGYVTIGTDVKKDFTEQTIEEIHKEVHRLQTELVSADELEKVRNYMLGAFAGSMNTPFDLADIFKSIYFSNLDYGFYEKYIHTIKTITAEEIQVIAQKYLNVADMLEVVVGDK